MTTIKIKVNNKSFQLCRILFDDSTGFEMIQYVGDGFLLIISPVERTLRINDTRYSADDAITILNKLEQRLQGRLK